MKLRGQLNLLLLVTAIVPFITTSLFSIQVQYAVQDQSELYVEAMTKAKVIGSSVVKQIDQMREPTDEMIETLPYYGDDVEVGFYSSNRQLLTQTERGSFPTYLMPADILSNLYELQAREGVFIYKEPVFQGDGLEGFYEVRFAQGDIQRDALFIYTLTFLFFICSSGITFYIVQHWFKKNMLIPFTWMKEQMQNIGDGKHDVKLHGSKHKRTEVGMLLDDFAIMTAQLNEIEQEKRRVEGNRQKLIASISHDLRTPLTSIRAYAEGMVANAGKRDEYASVILSKTRYMQRLIEDLLMYSHIQATSFLLDLQQVDAEELADTLYDGYKDEWTEHQFHIQLDHANVELLVDVDRLIQVVDNLVVNAIRYTPKHGAITLVATDDMSVLNEYGVKRMAGYYYFLVADTGAGISKEEQAHVFDSFYQVEKARNQSNETGVGLGLAICRELVQKHGGIMGVHSVLGKGSTFFFSLPIVTTEQNEGIT
ncbi:HAMP domain-containing sensor histidine kinase [Shouchella sp. 1P09AA]|uniref:sensor histidine kinase n=1 Tax=unclassified Shouchella TaxID=2893065 RepID=UPI00399F51C4